MRISLYRSYWKNRKENNSDYFACGWAEYKDEIYDAERLAILLSEMRIDSVDAMKSLAFSLNGNFALIVSSGNRVFIVSDRLRSYPIIYFMLDNILYLTDDIYLFRNDHDISFTPDDRIAEQFLCSNFIFGEYTIFQNVYSTRAADVIVWDGKNFLREQYFSWLPCMTDHGLLQSTIHEEAVKMDLTFKSAIGRIKPSRNQNLIVPLSGGHDSRIIVNYLYKAGIKNVICFSYGIAGNKQARISKQVAEALGYSWYFVEYTSDLMQEIACSGHIDNYCKYAFNGVALPCLQDFAAVYYLKKAGIVQNGDIFIPGHALDFIAGSHLSNDNKSILASLRRHFSEFGYAKRSRKLISWIESIIKKYKCSPQQLGECFNWQERQSKFIVNSVKCYEYFGLEWRIPLWDNEIVDYWMRVPSRCRYERNLFFAAEQNLLLCDQLRDIPFANNLKTPLSFRTRVASLMPSELKKILRLLGYRGTAYFVNEGSHLIYAQERELLVDYLHSKLPRSVKRYLKAYPKTLCLSGLGINSVSTLKNMRDAYDQ